MFRETIHLDQQLIQRLLTLIIATRPGICTLTAHRINLIDKDNAGSMLFRFLKKIAYPRRANANKHLNKLRATYTIERDTGLTGNGA
jgi:hypothetical protein